MSAANGHPPADKRCQLYMENSGWSTHLRRCANEGTHWVTWGGCDCPEPHDGLCEGTYESWECDGPCVTEMQEAA